METSTKAVASGDQDSVDPLRIELAHKLNGVPRVLSFHQRKINMSQPKDRNRLCWDKSKCPGAQTGHELQAARKATEKGCRYHVVDELLTHAVP